MSDYYIILDVEKTATPEQIRSSYKKLALKYHPDRFKGDNGEKFKKINEAYSVLNNFQKRKEYDSGMSSSFSQVNAFDIFNQFFTGNNSYKSTHIKSITYNIGVTLEQICLDKKLNIKFKRFVRCEVCLGNRTKDQQRPPICNKCNGRGNFQERLNFGGIIQVPRLTICNICKGDGFIIDIRNICNICSGEGKVNTENSVIVQCKKSLTLPGIFFPSEGNYNPLSKNYDKVIINFKIKKHPKFKKVGQYDISTNIDVSIIETLIGCEGKILHPRGHYVSFKTKTGETITEGDICIIKKEGLTSDGQLLVIFKIKKQHKLSLEIINDLKNVFKKHNLLK